MNQDVEVKLNMLDKISRIVQTKRDTKLRDVLVSIFKGNRKLINKHVGKKLVLSHYNKADRLLISISQEDLEKNISQFGKEGATSFIFSFRVARKSDKTVINLDSLEGIEINNKQVNEEAQKEIEDKKEETDENHNKNNEKENKIDEKLEDVQINNNEQNQIKKQEEIVNEDINEENTEEKNKKNETNNLNEIIDNIENNKEKLETDNKKTSVNPIKELTESKKGSNNIKIDLNNMDQKQEFEEKEKKKQSATKGNDGNSSNNKSNQMPYRILLFILGIILLALAWVFFLLNIHIVVTVICVFFGGASLLISFLWNIIKTCCQGWGNVKFSKQDLNAKKPNANERDEKTVETDSREIEYENSK